MKYDDILTKEKKEEIINDYVINFLSIRKLMKKYNIGSRVYIEKLLGDNVRSLSEAGKIAHKLYPEKFKHSDESKKKMREKRLSFLKEHPEKTAWRQSNMSYPEKQFIEFLKRYNYDKRFFIEREYSVFPYFIDFAFVDLKIAVEIDGSQHLEPERSERDKKKDSLLKSLGWRVIRIAAKTVLSDWKTINEKLDSFIDGDLRFEKVGIVEPIRHEYKKVEKNILYNGKMHSKGEIEGIKKQIRVQRPSKEELNRLIHEKPFTHIAQMYGVSDRCISHWCKAYGLPSRKKDIKIEI